MSQIENKLSEIIKEHLPEKVGAELKKVLSDFEDLKKRYEDLSDDQDKILRNEETLRSDIRELDNKNRTLSSENKEYKKREEELERREKELEITILRTQLGAEQSKSEAFSSFMQNLSRNTTYREEFFTNKSHDVPAHYDENNNWIADTVKTEMTNVTVTKETE